MNIIIVGLGIQGIKRKKIIERDFQIKALVDPIVSSAGYKNIKDVPLNIYDVVFICVNNFEKEKIIDYCLLHKKHFLVEKPLLLDNISKFKKIQQNAINNNLVCYTAYNHRFEPHFQKMKKIIDSGLLGKIYSCKMFYGNGTAQLVKSSKWKDKESGVLNDLAPHLLDTCIYWFGSNISQFDLVLAAKYENRTPDHIVIKSINSKIVIQLEMTYCMWRNSFTCDILAEKGSVHIDSLCKWGPSKFIIRKRKLPSGKPKEKTNTIIKKDPTWKKEHTYFKGLITKNRKTNLYNDIIISKILTQIKKKIDL